MLARPMSPVPAAMLAGSSVAFVALALLVAAGATRALDLATTIALQSYANGLFDLVANLNTLIGQPVVSAAAALALAAYLWRRERGLVWAAPLLIALTVVVGTGVKLFLEHPGPPEEFVRAWWNPVNVKIATPSAFPSGHVARVTFLAVLAAATWPGTSVRWLAGAVVVVTFLARIYIGDHWLSDAAGGLALGVGAGSLASAWADRSAGTGQRIDPPPARPHEARS